MIIEPHVSLLELVTSLSKAADLVSHAVVNHHKRVAYISWRLGEELGLSSEDISDLVIAAALHDIGAMSLKERIDALQFELENPHIHSETGYYLLKLFKPFTRVAEYVRFHHVPWNDGEGTCFRGHKVPVESHILHLADRVAVLINNQKEILSQVTDICSAIQKQKEKMFHPDVVEALKSLSGKEFFWLDCVANSFETIFGNLVKYSSLQLNIDGILDIANVFSVIVDFRCQFTANHSSGVAACAEGLAKLAGFSERDCKMIKIAGFLHDLGKLAIPAEILNKPSKLTAEEFQIIKSHAYYTYRILEPITGFEDVNSWASFHHECLNGLGYPFHHSQAELSTGSRIMAVADIFTALTEDRPYRTGMNKTNTLGILRQMADNKAIDPDIVSLLEFYYEDLNNHRLAAQDMARKDYESIRRLCV